MTNWRALQVPVDKETKQYMPQHGIKPKYFSGGTWKADSRKRGAKRQ